MSPIQIGQHELFPDALMFRAKSLKRDWRKRNLEIWRTTSGLHLGCQLVQLVSSL